MSIQSLMAGLIMLKILSMKRLVLLFGIALASSLAVAQDWPARPVKIVVPFAPGGSADPLGGNVAPKLSDQVRESFVIENRGGAGGALGSDLVAKAQPDGYTLVVSGIASPVIAPLLPQGTQYDPMKDFSHIALFGGSPAVLAVNPQLPAKNLKDFVALAKAKPGTLSYGSPGNGTQGQLVAELFKRLAGIDLQHVPYKGASGAVTDMIAGHIAAVSTTLSTAAGQIRAGRARGLAISASARLPEYPDIPTFAESGYPDLVATVWFSLSRPAGLRPQHVELLDVGMPRALELSDVKEKLRHEGITPNRLDAKEFAAFVADQLRRWGPIMRAPGANKD